MKHSFIMLWLLLYSWPIFPQNDRSHIYNDVTHPELLTERLIENKAWLNKNKTGLKNLNPVYVPIKIHLVAQSDGTGRLDASLAIAELCDLNQQYASTGITFYIKGGFNEIDHDPSYESPRSGSAVNRMISEKDNFAMNVFITQNADQTGIDNGTSLGYYNPNADLIVVRKSQVGTSSSTLAHEVGHYFSLRHPHYGWEDEPWTEEQFGNQVNITVVSSSQSGFQNVRVELVDGSNCETAADLLCDTPPDYNFGLRWPNSCPPFNLSVMDRNGDTLNPMMNNFMSYFIGCEPYQFTEMQGSVMIADYNSGRRSAIQSDFVPGTDPIIQEIQLLYPAFNETISAAEPITLEWTAAENATDYYIIVKGNGEEFRYITPETTITLPELAIGKTYSWTVHPFNDIGGCAIKKTGLFRTTDMSTAVEDPDFVHDVQVFPNPVSDGHPLSVKFYSSKNSPAVARIYDLSGKLLHSRNFVVQQGDNHLKEDLQYLKNGLYIYSVQISDQLLTRSFIKI